MSARAHSTIQLNSLVKIRQISISATGRSCWTTNGEELTGQRVCAAFRAPTGPVAFADVEDLDATRATLLAAGGTERSAPRQVAPEARVCVIADADGNPIGLRGR